MQALEPTLPGQLPPPIADNPAIAEKEKKHIWSTCEPPALYQVKNYSAIINNNPNNLGASQSFILVQEKMARTVRLLLTKLLSDLLQIVKNRKLLGFL